VQRGYRLVASGKQDEGRQRAHTSGRRPSFEFSGEISKRILTNMLLFPGSFANTGVCDKDGRKCRWRFQAKVCQQRNTIGCAKQLLPIHIKARDAPALR